MDLTLIVAKYSDGRCTASIPDWKVAKGEQCGISSRHRGLHLVFKLFQAIPENLVQNLGRGETARVLEQATQKENLVDKMSKNETNEIGIAA